jgi:MSHA biogenesis protein MshG
VPHYRYKARNTRGDLVEGVLEGASPDAVASQLITTGVIPIDITRSVATRSAVPSVWSRLLERRGVDIDDLIMFTRQLYSLVKAGVPIVSGLRGLKDSSHSGPMVESLEDVITHVEAGHELAASLARHPRIFTSLIVAMVRVGENTGRLEESLYRLSTYLQLEKQTRERVKSALRYPVLVLVAIGIAITVINIWVIPAFAGVFARANVALPWQTRAIIATSDFMVTYWHVLLGALVAGIVGARVYVSRPDGRYQWDKWKLRLPVVGSIIRKALLARFATGFAMSLRSGVPLIHALTVVARAAGNGYIAETVLQMRTGVERGDTLTRTAATTGLFTPLALQMLSVGENTGQVDDLLDEVGDFYEQEVDYEIKNLSSAIEPVLLVAIGVMVLILALGVFLPMWDLISAFKR